MPTSYGNSHCCWANSYYIYAHTRGFWPRPEQCTASFASIFTNFQFRPVLVRLCPKKECRSGAKWEDCFAKGSSIWKTILDVKIWALERNLRNGRNFSAGEDKSYLLLSGHLRGWLHIDFNVDPRFRMTHLDLKSPQMLHVPQEEDNMRPIRSPKLCMRPQSANKHQMLWSF